MNKARIEKQKNILMKKEKIFFQPPRKNENLPRYKVHNFEITCKPFNI